ncbi:MAG: hypothetical protein NVSMB46_03250 [Candidatus Saccharimonadales bacterium]
MITHNLSIKTRHNSLNTKQIHILKMLYKFRFLTAPLLTHYKSLKSRHAMYRSLEILADQGYIGRRIEHNSNFQNKGIRYYLTPKGLSFAKEKFPISPHVRHAMYKNNSVSEDFIDRTIAIVRVYLAIRDCSTNTFHIFTKNELADFNYFPDPPLDLWLKRITATDKLPNDYLLEFVSDTPLFIIKKRIDALIEHFDSGLWEAETNTNYPAYLFVCNDGKIEQRLQDHFNKVFDSTGIVNLCVFTTTTKALFSSDKNTTAIWTNVTQPSSLKSL